MKIVFVLLIFLLSACSQSEPIKSAAVEAATEPAMVEQIIDKAEASYQVAKEKQHAWINTGKLLATARAELAKGNVTAARVAAERALFTAEASVTQAQTQAIAWKDRVPK